MDAVCATCGKLLRLEDTLGGKGCPKCGYKREGPPFTISGVTCPFCKDKKNKSVDKGIITCTHCHKTFTREEKAGIELFKEFQHKPMPPLSEEQKPNQKAEERAGKEDEKASKLRRQRSTFLSGTLLLLLLFGLAILVAGIWIWSEKGF